MSSTSSGDSGTPIDGPYDAAQGTIVNPYAKVCLFNGKEKFSKVYYVWRCNEMDFTIDGFGLFFLFIFFARRVPPLQPSTRTGRC